MEFDLYEDEPKIFLRVWPEYGSSGIWVIDEPSRNWLEKISLMKF